MQNKDIKTLEDALIYITQQETEITNLTKLKDEALKGKLDAEVIANDAIEKASSAIENAPKEYTANVKGLGTVRVNFGADGVSKDALLDNHNKITELHKKGSGAVTVIEPAKGK